MTGIRKPKSPLISRPERQEPTAAPRREARSEEPLFPESAEESDLDIPAFLRRQAN
jgi:hypothetical protein